MLLKAMTVFFRSGEKILETIPQIGIERKNIGEVISNFTIIIEKLFSYIEYKNLYGFLDGLPLLMESLEEITNPY